MLLVCIIFLIVFAPTTASLEPTPTPQVIYQTKIVEVQKEPQFEVYEITAYTNGYESTGKRPGDRGYGITASGKPTVEMWTIACPPELPFGTKIYIEELKWTYSCQDRGSAITSGHLDIFIKDLNRANEFGRQAMHIFILPQLKEKSNEV